ncbi:hypothetical protein WJX81_007687 [Elliptochloris bilobata]|uniref:Solute carrier family 40 member n=1 Tax=Elliptochloris bilobata TaxID=381761 RepID=A0AAW1RUU4_9CHLO
MASEGIGNAAETSRPPQTQGEFGVLAALYGSHGLSTWGQRSWEFMIGLVLLELYPTSLTLVSAFGLIDGLALVLFGGMVGEYVDRSQRLRAACSMYALQNGALAVSAAALLAASLAARGGALFWGCNAATVLFGAASSLFALGSSLAVEREWPKVLCGGDSAALSRLNSGMRRIDLSCLIVSPIGVGLLMTYAGTRAAILAVLAWNLAAWVPECLLAAHAVHRCDALQQPKAATGAEPGPAKGSLRRMWRSWATYAQQPTAPAAAALALLYCTVLSLGLLMTAYLRWLGLAEAELSLWRGAGALAGIGATFAYPRLHAAVGVEASGALGIWLQLACLLAAVAPAALARLGWAQPGASVAVARALVAALAASRAGLWLFDLAVGQMLQERVLPQELGVVNGVQSSAQMVFQSLSYVAGLFVWQPQVFEWLMFGSCAVVLFAAIIYTVFVHAALVSHASYKSFSISASGPG